MRALHYTGPFELAFLLRDETVCRISDRTIEIASNDRDPVLASLGDWLLRNQDGSITVSEEAPPPPFDLEAMRSALEWQQDQGAAWIKVADVLVMLERARRPDMAASGPISDQQARAMFGGNGGMGS